LRIAQGIQQYEENKRNKQNVKYAHPIEALKYEEDVIQEIRHRKTR
jgi:hypothetical protein